MKKTINAAVGLNPVHAINKANLASDIVWEYGSIVEKVENLERFINAKPKGIDKQNMDLLKEQIAAMNAYKEILKKRLIINL